MRQEYSDQSSAVLSVRSGGGGQCGVWEGGSLLSLALGVGYSLVPE